jgi:F0F1-type ATP synthase assembly protein I
MKRLLIVLLIGLVIAAVVTVVRSQMSNDEESGSETIPDADFPTENDVA